MSSTDLYRWSGLAALLGGGLIALLSILETFLFGGQSDSATVTTSAWFIVEIAFIVAEVLIILGLVGLYAHQADKAGTLGLIAFLISLTGTVMIVGIEWSAAFLGPWLAETGSTDLLAAEPTGAFLSGLLLTLALVAVGYFLFGLASYRAKVLPRNAAVLLMIGAALVMVFGFLEVGFDVVVMGAGLAWMGYGLWSSAGVPDMVAEPAV